MSNLVPHESGRVSPSRLTRREAKERRDLEQTTNLRAIAVRADGAIATEKANEIDALAGTAISGQALLVRGKETLAAGDPLLQDDLNFFVQMAKVGKGEIIAQTVTGFAREGR